MVSKLGLPETTQAVLFDLDGVITQTAKVHAAAWKQMFDEFLAERAKATGTEFVPFSASDYDSYVDGKPRADGTRSFLAARGITLPEGSPDDEPGAPTVNGLSNRKNVLVLQHIEQDGVQVYDGSVRYLQQARDAGLRIAVVSSSANTTQVLDAVGLRDRFDVQVDGLVAKRLGLAGKPAPATYLEAAKLLDVPPSRAVVFEDALAGVEAGRAGGFGWVVGVDRVGQAEALREHGADIVVHDLAELMEA
jgi:beta-phosphoglucomutase family hydrolase